MERRNMEPLPLQNESDEGNNETYQYKRSSNNVENFQEQNAYLDLPLEDQDIVSQVGPIGIWIISSLFPCSHVWKMFRARCLFCLIFSIIVKMKVIYLIHFYKYVQYYLSWI